MDEQVRLIIWDLDETFWKGTLSEGGITYIQSHHDLVIELAHRGVMSSICSKNELNEVRNIFQANGLWDFFIFPSVDWSPKGVRIRQIIDSVQLRAPTVLFIDDNHLNRAEAQSAAPGLQVADESIIATIADNPLFRGKNDVGLTRLKHYKLLEEKAVSRANLGGDNRAFLEQSGIRIRIDSELDDKLDRVVELVNRTNQLNFTKRRLPDNIDDAKAELREDLSPYYARAGLVDVEDRYGSYGYCGFFLLHGAWENVKVRHFAFSCRVLGMGVEQWVYDVIGRPEFEIEGKVLSTLDFSPDWINRADAAHDVTAVDYVIPEVRIRGACELEVMQHFFRANAKKTTAEFVRYRGFHVINEHNSAMLANAVRGYTETQLTSLRALGFAPEDLRSDFLQPAEPRALLIFSPTGDGAAIYRRKSDGFKITVDFANFGVPQVKTAAEIEAFTNASHFGLREKALFGQALQELQDNYEIVTQGWETVLEEDYRVIADSVPDGSLLVVLLPNRFYKDGDDVRSSALITHHNEAFKRVVGRRNNVIFVEVSDLLDAKTEVKELLHYTRNAYRKIFDHINKVYRSWAQGMERF